jgi:Tfp pilus assembly protein PilX
MVMAAVLICLFILMLVTAGLVRMLVLQQRQAAIRNDQMQAQWLAESGLDRAYSELQRNADYGGETAIIPRTLDAWSCLSIREYQADDDQVLNSGRPTTESFRDSPSASARTRLASYSPARQAAVPAEHSTEKDSGTKSNVAKAESAGVHLVSQPMPDVKAIAGPQAENWCGWIEIQIFTVPNQPNWRRVRIEGRWQGPSALFPSTHVIETVIPLAGAGATL